MNRPKLPSGLWLRCAPLLLVWALFALTGCSPETVPAEEAVPTRAETLETTSSPMLQPVTPEESTPTPTKAFTPTAAPAWEGDFTRLRWVAYSPTLADPNRGIEGTQESMLQDLRLLRQAGFTGLVTYSALGIQGVDLPYLAQDAGFEGLIIGVWNPANQDELASAAAAAKLPIVLGYCVGNEGLNVRYDLAQLTAAITELKAATQKPVATTEEIDDYADAELLSTGDWVFPNAHPYFHSLLEPELAARWTQAAYEDLARRAGRLVIFKEVGLPTAGSPDEPLSEENQKLYYQALAATEIRFVYFEAFDQPWKTHLPVEPHWGLFRADRSPKSFAASLMDAPTSEPAAASPSRFYIYRDLVSPENHFKPTGFMGDIGDITLNEAYTQTVFSGETAIQITYDAQGRQPTNCPYGTCKWAGVYWQEPPNNWGKSEFWKEYGYDLTGFTRLLFWAKADQTVEIYFKVGGITGPYGDSLIFPRVTQATLTPEWQEFEVDLSYADLSHVIGGFVWVCDWSILRIHGITDKEITFYLDEIRYEK